MQQIAQILDCPSNIRTGSTYPLGYPFPCCVIVMSAQVLAAAVDVVYMHERPRPGINCPQEVTDCSFIWAVRYFTLPVD